MNERAVLTRRPTRTLARSDAGWARPRRRAAPRERLAPHEHHLASRRRRRPFLREHRRGRAARRAARARRSASPVLPGSRVRRVSPRRGGGGGLVAFRVARPAAGARGYRAFAAMESAAAPGGGDARSPRPRGVGAAEHPPPRDGGRVRRPPPPAHPGRRARQEPRRAREDGRLGGGRLPHARSRRSSACSTRASRSRPSAAWKPRREPPRRRELPKTNSSASLSTSRGHLARCDSKSGMADAAANVVARASRVRCEVEGEGGDVVCRIDGDVLEVMEPERVAARVAALAREMEAM